MKEYKILFLSLGTKGDFFPFLGLAREFKARGYSTLVLGCENIRNICDQEGIEFEAIQTTEEYCEVFENPLAWKPKTGLEFYYKMILAATERSYRAIERQAVANKCFLICKDKMMAGVLAYEKLKLPTACLYLSPYAHISYIDPAKVSPFYNFLTHYMGLSLRKLFMKRYFKKANTILYPLNEFRAKLGLPAITDFTGTFRNSIPLKLNLWPEWFCPYKSDWPPQTISTGFINYCGPKNSSTTWIEKASCSDFLSHKPIVFAMGTGLGLHFEDYIALFSKVCQKIQKQGILVSPSVHGKDSVDVNEYFKIIKFAPFDELFNYASIIVNHGGLGTISQALSAGKPQIITPFGHDQFENGYQVERLGAGFSIPFWSLTCNNLSKALQNILYNTSFQERSSELSKKLAAENGTLVACDLIESKIPHA